MHIGRIRNSNCIMRGDGGEIADLHVRTGTFEDGSRYFMSAWLPTPDELERLNKGEPVILTIYGQGHPPVMLCVPED